MRVLSNDLVLSVGPATSRWLGLGFTASSDDRRQSGRSWDKTQTAPANTGRAPHSGLAGDLLRRRYQAALTVALMIVVGLSCVTSANAEKVRFGRSDEIVPLQDVAITRRDGEKLYLGHMISRSIFLLPYHMRDNGYVLGVKGGGRWYPLSAQQIRSYQARGLLPDPLPGYQISPLEWVVGYSAWIALIGFGAWFAWAIRATRRSRRVTALVAQADAAQAAADFNRAVEHYSQALTLAPKNLMARHNRACAYEALGQHRQAVDDRSFVVKLVPKSPEALVARGVAHQNDDDHDQAITDFSRALRLHPEHAVALLARAISYNAQGSYDRAIEDCSRAIILDPNAPACYQNRAYAYEKIGKAALAKADLEQAEQLLAVQSSEPAGSDLA